MRSSHANPPSLFPSSLLRSPLFRFTEPTETLDIYLPHSRSPAVFAFSTRQPPSSPSLSALIALSSSHASTATLTASRFHLHHPCSHPDDEDKPITQEPSLPSHTDRSLRSHIRSLCCLPHTSGAFAAILFHL